MKRIAIIDTYYPAFLSTIGFNEEDSYAKRLTDVLELSFGTADFCSRHLRMEGWNATDIVANYDSLQLRWAAENRFEKTDREAIAIEQIRRSESSAVFVQDLSFFSVPNLIQLKEHYLLTGQCSCQMPDIRKVRCFDLIFTSLPHYVKRFEKLGVEGVYMPLAFDPVVLDRVGPRPERGKDCLFVGGLGWQWPNGNAFLNHLAGKIPTAEFYGYGYEKAPAAVRAKYRGPAWALDMYRLLLSTKIAINRHGLVAETFANNLRMFEATGCGALLLTEKRSNMRDLFAEDEVVEYVSPEDATDKIRYFLDRPDELDAIATRGQQRTWRDHTYANRMPDISAILESRLQ